MKENKKTGGVELVIKQACKTSAPHQFEAGDFIHYYDTPECPTKQLLTELH